MARNRILKLRSDMPFAALDEAILTLLQHSVGKPCPTRAEFMLWTGMARRRVWPYLEDMMRRGKIEMEVAESRQQGKDPKRRRMRAAGGEWTGWTDRPGSPFIADLAKVRMAKVIVADN